MLKSSLLEIIRTFSKQELIKFEDFVRSPYFNKKENVLKLFLEIKKYAPEFTDANLEKEKIWVKVFPGKEYNYGIMKNLIHELAKLCESFLTIEFSKSDKLRNNIDLLKTLLKRKITKVFSSKIDMMEKIYDKPDLKNGSYKIEDYYEFLDKLYYLKSLYNRHYNIDSTAAYKYICRSIDCLIYSAIINFYKYYNNYLTNGVKIIPNKDNTAPMFLEGLNKYLILSLLKNLKVKSGRDYLILKCFCDMSIAIVDEKDMNSYFNFKKSLQDCLDLIPKPDLKDLLICLTNSLIHLNVNKSVSGINFYMELLENYDLMIENDIFLEPSGMMSGSLFLSYVMSAFHLKEYERIEILAKKFGDKLPEYRRDNDNTYSQALIYYGKKEYRKSLELVSRINHDLQRMKHMVKNIQMINYYELNDYISFSYVADSYRHFLSKNKSVNSYDKSRSENLCNSINKLFKLREEFDKYELEKFKKNVKEIELQYMYWILDKIEEIEIVNS